jgi:hypothetical protein
MGSHKPAYLPTRNSSLIKHLAQYGYHPTAQTSGLFTHDTRPITFTLDFGIKYIGKEHTNHLIAAIKDLNTATTNWDGTLYCGITLKWDYQARTLDMSMPDYITKALTKFCIQTPQCLQHMPHVWVAPTYGTKIQYTDVEDTTRTTHSNCKNPIARNH